MSQAANVRSVEALKDFKVAMIAYAEDAVSALTSVDMEIRRTRGWLERDQLAFWRQQVKWRQAEVSMARTELHRRRLSQSNSNVISDTEQKEALKLAQRRLAEAEAKVERVKKWIPVLEQAIAEYHSHSQRLGDRLSGGFENSLAALDRMVSALEAYLALAPPSAPRFAPEGSSSSGPSVAESTSFARTGAAVAPPHEPAEEAPPAESASAAPPTEAHAGVGAATGPFEESS